MSRKSCLALALPLACLTAPTLSSTGFAAPCAPLNLDFGQKSPQWAHQPLSKLKRDTVYKLVNDGSSNILTGSANGSASLYLAGLKPPLNASATLNWRWQADAPVPGADNRKKELEDSPLRVMIAFDGDRSTLPENEQKRFKRAKSIAGRDLPYAVLMYIWSEQGPVESIIPSAHTSQIKMIVAASGSSGIGQWQSLRRNIADDYRRAYGSEPGPVTGIAVMTDTDNTGAKAVGQYANIRIECSGK